MWAASSSVPVDSGELYDLFRHALGHAPPDAERFGSSYVLQLGDEYLMFDCGPAATHKLVKVGLWDYQGDARR